MQSDGKQAEAIQQEAGYAPLCRVVIDALNDFANGCRDIFQPEILVGAERMPAHAVDFMVQQTGPGQIRSGKTVGEAVAGR